MISSRLVNERFRNEPRDKLQVIVNRPAEYGGGQASCASTIYIFRGDIGNVRENTRERRLCFIFVEVIRDWKLGQFIAASDELGGEITSSTLMPGHEIADVFDPAHPRGFRKMQQAHFVRE